MSALIFFAVIISASAQQAGTAMSVPEIATCLCLEPRLEEARTDIEAKRALLKERADQLAALETEIAKKQASLDPADTVGQTVLKNFINQASYLRRLIQKDLQPALNQSVAEYNALLGTYNRDCAKRPRYAVDVEMARKNLVCPQP